jgi:hypothetical protein
MTRSLSTGRTLRTLRDAAEYIVGLPEKTSRQEHWQIAFIT